jgi:hypothetical protein
MRRVWAGIRHQAAAEGIKPPPAEMGIRPPGDVLIV